MAVAARRLFALLREVPQLSPVAERAALQLGPRVVAVARMPGAPLEENLTVLTRCAPQLNAWGWSLGVNVGGRERGCSIESALEAVQRRGVTWAQIPERAASEFSALDKLPSGVHILRSCHDVAGVEAAIRQRASLCTLSPVWPTESKPQHPGLGVDYLESVARRFPHRVVALGGVGAAQLDAVDRLPLAGVATASRLNELLSAMEAAAQLTPETGQGRA